MSGILYKFLSVENALRVLEQHRLKVSLIRELNDIYDCAPIPGPTSEDPDSSNQRERSKRVLDQNSENFGLLCFSYSYHSPLLWGHYAAGATGVALGFDSKRFNWGAPIEVRYNQNRPIFEWPATGETSALEMVKGLSTCFGVKAEEWKYEQEVRYVVNLDHCELSSGMYFVEFVGLALREVIIGRRCSVTPTYLRHFLGKHYEGLGVSLYTSSEHDERYEITIQSFPVIQPKLKPPPGDKITK